MILTARRLFRIAIATQIGSDNCKFAGQSRRDLVPVQMVERVAMQQQNRRPMPTCHGDDARAAGFDFRSLEAFEHIRTCLAVMAVLVPASHASTRILRRGCPAPAGMISERRCKIIAVTGRQSYAPRENPGSRFAEAAADSRP